MSLSLGDIEFDGPFSKLSDLDDAPGIFAVLNYEDMQFKFVELRKARLVQTEVAKALSTKSWSSSPNGKLRIAVCYSTDATEMSIIMHQVLNAEFACEAGSGM